MDAVLQKKVSALVCCQNCCLVLKQKQILASFYLVLQNTFWAQDENNPFELFNQTFFFYLKVFFGVLYRSAERSVYLNHNGWQRLDLLQSHQLLFQASKTSFENNQMRIMLSQSIGPFPLSLINSFRRRYPLNGSKANTWRLISNKEKQSRKLSRVLCPVWYHGCFEKVGGEPMTRLYLFV